MNFRGTRPLPSKIAGAPDQRSKKNRASPYFLWISARLSSPKERKGEKRSGAQGAIFDGRGASPPIPGPLRFLWNRRGPAVCRRKSQGHPIRDRGPRGRFSTADEEPFFPAFFLSEGIPVKKSWEGKMEDRSFCSLRFFYRAMNGSVKKS